MSRFGAWCGLVAAFCAQLAGGCASFECAPRAKPATCSQIPSEPAWLAPLDPGNWCEACANWCGACRPHDVAQVDPVFHGYHPTSWTPWASDCSPDGMGAPTGQSEFIRELQQNVPSPNRSPEEIPSPTAPAPQNTGSSSPNDGRINEPETPRSPPATTPPVTTPPAAPNSPDAASMDGQTSAGGIPLSELAPAPRFPRDPTQATALNYSYRAEPLPIYIKPSSISRDNRTAGPIALQLSREPAGPRAGGSNLVSINKPVDPAAAKLEPSLGKTNRQSEATDDLFQPQSKKTREMARFQNQKPPTTDRVSRAAETGLQTACEPFDRFSSGHLLRFSADTTSAPLPPKYLSEESHRASTTDQDVSTTSRTITNSSNLQSASGVQTRSAHRQDSQREFLRREPADVDAPPIPPSGFVASTAAVQRLNLLR